MIRQIRINDSLQDMEFAKRAAKKFEQNPDLVTYTDGEIEEGELFAIKWGLGRDCVLVFRIGDEPRNYTQIIGHDND